MSSRAGAFDEADLELLGMLAEVGEQPARHALERHADRSVRAVRLRAAQALTGLAWWELDPGTGRHDWSDEMFQLVGLEPSDSPPTTRSSSP